MRIWIALIILILTCSLTASAQSQTPGSQRPVTQQEIDQLKQQILNEDRSTAEAITEFHHESGDLNNRLDQFRYGGRLNLRLNSSGGVYLTATRTKYMPLISSYGQWGTNFTGGVMAKISDAADFRIEGGVTRFSTDTTTFNGSATLRFSPTDLTNFYAIASRSNVDESLLSVTGLRAVSGPFAGQLVGRVMDNRAVFGGSARLPANFDVFGEGGIGNREGVNVPSNFFGTVGGGIGYTILATGGEDPLSHLRAAYEINYTGFQDDRFGFGGASLVSRTNTNIPVSRIGSDGISPVPAAGHPGVGGYFSPRNFLSGVFRGEAQGGSESTISYRVTGFFGSQAFTGTSRHLAYGGSGTVTFALTDRFSLPVTFMADNYGPFTQQSLYARLVIRF